MSGNSAGDCGRAVVRGVAGDIDVVAMIVREVLILDDVRIDDFSGVRGVALGWDRRPSAIPQLISAEAFCSSTSYNCYHIALDTIIRCSVVRSIAHRRLGRGRFIKPYSCGFLLREIIDRGIGKSNRPPVSKNV